MTFELDEEAKEALEEEKKKQEGDKLLQKEKEPWQGEN